MEEATSTLTLYHDISSNCSQKVRVALAEKGLPYKSHVVSLRESANLEPWYMKLNPLGLVPTLVDGSKTVADSNDIIDYLEKTYPDNPLLPTEDSPRSHKLRQMHQDINKLNIATLTVGAFLYPELTDGGLVPRGNIQEFNARYTDGKQVEMLQKFAEENPDLREAYLQKLAIAKQRSRPTGYITKVAVEGQLAMVNNILSDMEQFLSEHATDAAPWLGGSKFGLADIFLTITLLRLKFVGFSKGLWEGSQCPNLARYVTNALRRQSVQKESLCQFGAEIKI